MSNPQIKDRIVEFKRVKASELQDHPNNWRLHPDFQKDAMQAVLEEVGFAGAILCYKEKDKLVIIDGHLRKDITPDMELPCLITDLTARGNGGKRRNKNK